MSARKAAIRCAIYTRKSTDEGLDQAFNSLHAQREACEAYIQSQSHEGWHCLSKHYDDGGHSGGTMERPALQHLLADIKTCQLDVIVIYKIDRLTRSLADFARLAELLDEHGVSFVSVTQQFNTTTSMGRLMLNVLLSFAQFEREITGERIRDKIAASKRKGLWMGGTTPMGYDTADRQLVVNPADARIVKEIFRLYLEAGSVPALQRALKERGIHTKTRVLKDGTRASGGLTFYRGHLYRMLSNAVYVGRIPHKKESYPGTHEPIIDADTWQAVQRQLGDNQQGGRARRIHNATSPSLLAGLIYDSNGNRFTPSHSVKQGRRYRYYVAQRAPLANGAPNRKPLRIPAIEIESVVRSAITGLLGSPQRLLEVVCESAAPERADRVLKRAAKILHDIEGADARPWLERIRPTLVRVTLAKSSVEIVLDPVGLRMLLGLPDTDMSRSSSPETTHGIVLNVPAEIRVRGIQMKLVVSDPDGIQKRAEDTALIRAVARAHLWFEEITSSSGTTIADIARRERTAESYVARVLKLAFLDPTIVEAILDGRQPPDVTIGRLTLAGDIPASWLAQRRDIL